MSAEKLWLEYRLDRLTFQNGRSVTFGGETRMLYNPDENVIAVETSALKRMRVRENIGDGQEMRRIEYSMLFNLPGERGTAFRFFHPMKKGNGVRVVFNDRGELFFRQDDGRALFSKDYTVADVTRGAIKADRAVWQFHGYKHEH